MRSCIRLFVPMAVVAFAIMFPIVAAHAQSGIARMAGSVADETAASKYGKFVAIAGAKVELEQVVKSSPRKFTTTTDKRGVYRFPEIPYGDYTVRISAPGYRDYELRFFVDSDASAEITILLRKIVIPS
jgi:hypothetical protein